MSLAVLIQVRHPQQLNNVTLLIHQEEMSEMEIEINVIHLAMTGTLIDLLDVVDPKATQVAVMMIILMILMEVAHIVLPPLNLEESVDMTDFLTMNNLNRV